MGTVVFDLDGTLADTSGDLIAAANAVFIAGGHGAVLDPQADAATAFRGGRAMLTLGYARLDDRDAAARAAAVEAGYADLLTAYEARIDDQTALYPGALEAVAALRDQGHGVSICTNKPEALADLLLRRLGVRDVFDGLVGADTLPVRKPDPAPYHEAVRRAGGESATSVLIGDTVTDRDTARAAEVPCILVTFGPDGHAVADLGPTGLLGRYADLPDLIAHLLPLWSRD